MKCGTCKYFDRNQSAKVSGLCRRYAPRVLSASGIRNEWPKVFEGDWCGEHEKQHQEVEALPEVPTWQP